MEEFEKYSKCNHVLVLSHIEYDGCDGKKSRYYGCIKCGLNEELLLRAFKEGTRFFTSSERKKYNYLKLWRSEHLTGLNGEYINYACNIDLATAIYRKIKEAHPGIDDETAIKYFQIAIDKIRAEEVSEERQKDRARRLGLFPWFKGWNSESITEYNGYY